MNLCTSRAHRALDDTLAVTRLMGRLRRGLGASLVATLGAGLLVGLQASPASAAVSLSGARMWAPNTSYTGSADTAEKINAIVKSGDVLYVGGSFSQLRPEPGAGVPSLAQANLYAVDTRTGAYLPAFRPAVNGIVEALEVDAATGTLFVGGRFTQVNGQANAGFAILDAATGQLKAGITQRPVNKGGSTPGVVMGLKRVGRQLYVAGDFVNIGGVAAREPGPARHRRRPHARPLVPGLHRRPGPRRRRRPGQPRSHLHRRRVQRRPGLFRWSHAAGYAVAGGIADERPVDRPAGRDLHPQRPLRHRPRLHEPDPRAAGGGPQRPRVRGLRRRRGAVRHLQPEHRPEPPDAPRRRRRPDRGADRRPGLRRRTLHQDLRWGDAVPAVLGARRLAVERPGRPELRQRLPPRRVRGRRRRRRQRLRRGPPREPEHHCVAGCNLGNQHRDLQPHRPALAQPR